MISSRRCNQKCPEHLLPILSLNKFAYTIGIQREKLKALAIRAESCYSPVMKKTGNKLREIDNPAGFLKEVQKRINERILSTLSFPEYVIGGVKGRKPSEHPRRHIGKSVVITLDVKNCFPNITNQQVFDIWHKQLGCSHDVARLATRLTTRKGHLPLGASTSNCLANLALQPCLKSVVKTASQCGFSTDSTGQYVDDLAFSGDTLSEEFISAVVKEFSRHGFIIKREKIIVMRSNEPQIVTKKIVNKKVSLPIQERNRIRAALNELKNTDSSTQSYLRLYRSVLGRINSMKEFHPELAEKMLGQVKILSNPCEIKSKEAVLV
jgi:hypothetical protein